jgi:hypothetical protein
VRLLLGKCPDMAERGEAAEEAERAVAANPRFLEAGAAFPATGALFIDVPGVDLIGLLPLGAR